VGSATKERIYEQIGNENLQIDIGLGEYKVYGQDSEKKECPHKLNRAISKIDAKLKGWSNSLYSYNKSYYKGNEFFHKIESGIFREV